MDYLLSLLSLCPRFPVSLCVPACHIPCLAPSAPDVCCGSRLLQLCHPRPPCVYYIGLVPHSFWVGSVSSAGFSVSSQSSHLCLPASPDSGGLITPCVWVVTVATQHSTGGGWVGGEGGEIPGPQPAQERMHGMTWFSIH